MNIDTDSEEHNFKRNAKPQILIIEPLLTGHHGNYLQNLATGALKRNYSVIIATSETNRESPLLNWAKNSEDIKLDFNECLNFTFKGTDGVLGLLKRELLYYYNFMKVHAQHKFENIDFVVLPYADYCLYAIGLLGSPFGNTKWKGIAMRPSFHHREMGIQSKHDKSSPLKRWLFRRMLKSPKLLGIFTIDPVLQEYCHRHWVSEEHKLHYIPDPAEIVSPIQKTQARKFLKIGDDCCVILVYGALSHRKGVQNLLPFLAHKQCDSNFHLLMVGETDAQFRQLLKSDEYTIIENNAKSTLLDTRATTELQNIVFSAADISWLGYHQHYGMSGVLVLSELYDLPSLVSSKGLIGWLNNKFHFGMNADKLSLIQFSSSKELIDNCSEIRNRTTSQRNDFMSQHNWNYTLKLIYDNRYVY